MMGARRHQTTTEAQEPGKPRQPSEDEAIEFERLYDTHHDEATGSTQVGGTRQRRGELRDWYRQIQEDLILDTERKQRQEEDIDDEAGMRNFC